MLLYGAETWRLRKVEERRLQAFVMWIWRRMESILWNDRVTNEEVLGKAGEKRSVGYHQRNEEKLVGTLYAANTR